MSHVTLKQMYVQYTGLDDSEQIHSTTLMQ